MLERYQLRGRECLQAGGVLRIAAVQRRIAEILLAMARHHDIKPFTSGAHASV
jgi:hypothetical protein